MFDTSSSHGEELAKLLTGNKNNALLVLTRINQGTRTRVRVGGLPTAMISIAIADQPLQSMKQKQKQQQQPQQQRRGRPRVYSV